MDSTTSILLAEEDAAARAFLADNLAADGYEVLLADSKAAARREARGAPAGHGHLRRQRRDARPARRRARGPTGSPRASTPTCR